MDADHVRRESVPAPADPRTQPVRSLNRIMPLIEADDEAIADLELLREIDRRDRNGEG